MARTIGLILSKNTENTGKALSEMKKAELLALATEKGITVPDKATNPEIVKLIEEAGGQDE